jgi:putative ABC transport system substrate-binding protein
MKQLRQLFVLAVIVLTALLLSACGAGTSAAPKVVKVGILNSNNNAELNVSGFKDGMAKLGYVEGTNITYIYDGPIGDAEEQKTYIKSLVEQDVDLIFSNGTKASTSAQAAAGDTPIVFAPVAFPVDAGLVASLSKPGGTITGVANGASHGRRLQTLVEIVPSIKRIYVPMDPNETVSNQALAVIQPAADELKVELVVGKMVNEEEMDKALADFPDDVDAILLLPGSWMADTLPQWVDLAIEKKLPLSSDGAPEAGGLFSLDASDYEVGVQAARLADTILKGANPGDLPVETPEFALTVNLKTAAAIGLTVPDAILNRADTIIR